MRRLVAAALLAAAPVSGAAWGQAIDFSKGGSIEVTSLDGMEWRQNERVVIARGQARAVRGDVTVTADRLLARYRPRAPAAGAAPAAPGAPADTGSNEIYRLEAEGNVRISTPSDVAQGERAVYDIDQAVLLMTGRDLKLTTPQQVLTARDSMEYWSQRNMAVGRGAATVTTADGRKLSADTLVGYTNPAAPAPTPAVVRPGAAPAAIASGKLQRVEGFGNVEVRTAAETIRGQRGVYVADTGIARLAGTVRITRGANQLNGDEAVVNMRTGVSTLNRTGNSRVQGLVVPNEAAPPGAPAGAPPAPPRR